MPTQSNDGRGRRRDPRLDFFRGLGMFIILMAHIPWNAWTDWIPARFGFSDAADLFVFCSGIASALAFAKVFDDWGWWNGAARIVHRMWQVYWAHVTSFLVVAALVVAADSLLGGGRYVRELGLEAFFAEPRSHLTGLMTLTYVPEYFDILAMYLAILAMIPIVMALGQIHRSLVGVAVVGSWFAANLGIIGLTADATTGRPWFFNPFAWQIVFFTGFAFARGWAPRPPHDRRFVFLAIAIVVAAAPFSCQYGFSCYAGFGMFPRLGEIHEALDPLINKTNMGLLRYLHFIATAYLAYVFAGERGVNLTGPVVAVLQRVGQQTLAVFLSGLVAAQALGIALDLTGRTPVMTALANLAGMAILIITAFVVAWLKAPPWRRRQIKTDGRATIPRQTPASQSSEATYAPPALPGLELRPAAEARHGSRA
jgi:hypothetical protein